MTRNKSIVAEHVGKKFLRRRSSSHTLKSTVLETLRIRTGSRDEFWALRDISFTVDTGETLGIIGANGAGKSTLLALLAGTKVPTNGRLTTHGTISSLLELGAGFHPELTGRENVYLAGAVMGIPRARMKERFSSIIEFAGLHDFIDQPVKHYSSGMYVRLGFAVAVEVDPDILLIDEVLSVGDASFQRKCIERMEAFRKCGKTMLIISHDLPTIQSVSDRILLLEEGKLLGIGAPSEVVDRYESLTRRKNAKTVEREWGTGEVKITGVEFLDEAGRSTDKFQWGKSLTARISYDAQHRIENPVFGFALASEAGLHIYGNNTQIERCVLSEINGKGSISLTIDPISMGAGTYLFSFSVHSSDHKVNYHRVDNRFPVLVESDKEFEGCCYMPVKWSKGD